MDPDFFRDEASFHVVFCRNWLAFIGEAHQRDAGEAAAQKYLKLSLGDLVAGLSRPR